MNYFSLVQMQDHTNAARKHLRDLSRHSDAYRDHCLIWKLFPGHGAKRDFLFRRRQQQQQSGPLSYYIVSERPPQSVPELFTLQTKPYHPQLAAGEWFRFELQANPTVSRKYGPPANGTRRPSKRHDVLMDAKSSHRGKALPTPVEEDFIADAALTWLLQQGAKYGMEVQPDSVLTNAYTRHQIMAKGRNVQFSSIDYCGVAQVTDPALLKTALLHGIGHARGFGCGLMIVQRMQ